MAENGSARLRTEGIMARNSMGIPTLHNYAGRADRVRRQQAADEAERPDDPPWASPQSRLAVQVPEHNVPCQVPKPDAPESRPRPVACFSPLDIVTLILPPSPTCPEALNKPPAEATCPSRSQSKNLPRAGGSNGSTRSGHSSDRQSRWTPAPEKPWRARHGLTKSPC
jgi:hypothetical protein